MTPEGKVKARGRKILNAMGMYHFPPFSGGYGRAGVPDDVGCYRGRFVGIEYKAGKGKLTAIQIKNLEDIEKCGGVALVINEDNVDNLEELIEDGIRRQRNRASHG